MIKKGNSSYIKKQYSTDLLRRYKNLISKNNDKFIFYIIAALLFFAVSIFGYSVYLQNQNINQQNNLRELIVENSQNINNEQIDQYLSGQNNLKNMWWHTIINQSGLSIITTLIVLIITTSVGYLYKTNMDKEYQLELEKIKQQNNEFIRELILLQNSQGELNRGLSGQKQVENDIEVYVRRLNGINRLNSKLSNIIKKEDTLLYLNNSINGFVKYSIANIMNYDEDSLKTIFFFNQIKNNEHQNKIIDYLINKKETYEKQEGKEKQVKYCNELIDLLQKDVI
jgi:hypothetical protein